jgi:rRNA maturation endonuclease Nob1
MAWKPDGDTQQKMIDEAKEAADRAEQNARQSEFEVKGPSDQHIIETEKAAADAVEGSEKDE